MTSEEKVNLINCEYASKAQDFFPFISKVRITILKEGYYKKQKSNYRGLGVVYDPSQRKSKVILLGYYYVDKNYVVVPDGLEITPNKKVLISNYETKGFEVLQGKFPSLKPIEFDLNSEEYKITIDRKNNFLKSKNDISNYQ
jgi:hypothetical protein